MRRLSCAQGSSTKRARHASLPPTEEERKRETTCAAGHFVDRCTWLSHNQREYTLIIISNDCAFIASFAELASFAENGEKRLHEGVAQLAVYVVFPFGPPVRPPGFARPKYVARVRSADDAARPSHSIKLRSGYARNGCWRQLDVHGSFIAESTPESNQIRRA